MWEESAIRGSERTLTSPTSVLMMSPGLMLVGRGLGYGRSVGLGTGVADRVVAVGAAAVGDAAS